MAVRSPLPLWQAEQAEGRVLSRNVTHPLRFCHFLGEDRILSAEGALFFSLCHFFSSKFLEPVTTKNKNFLVAQPGIWGG